MQKFYPGSKQISLVKAAYDDAQLALELKSKLLEIGSGKVVRKGQGPTREQMASRNHEQQLRQGKVYAIDLVSGFESLADGDESSTHRPDKPTTKRRKTQPFEKSDAAAEMLSQFAEVGGPARPFVLVFAEDHTGKSCLSCRKSLLKRGEKKGKQIQVRAFVSKRPYRDPATGKATSGPANAYFHFNQQCLTEVIRFDLPKFEYAKCRLDDKMKDKVDAPEFAKVKEHLQSVGVQ